MKTRYFHFSRKLRQLRHTCKSIQRMMDAEQWTALNPNRQSKWLNRLRRLTQNLSGFVPRRQMRKAFAGSALLLGLALGNSLEAQVTFAEPIQDPFGLSNPFDITYSGLTDIDGDGDYDLLAGSYNENQDAYSFKLYENIGTAESPTFDTPVDQPFNLTQEGVTNPVLVDIDDDGDLDLFSGEYNYNGSGILFFENSGTDVAPNFEPVLENPFGIATDGLEVTFIAAGDMDDDGDFDLMLGTAYGTDKILFYENIGTETTPSFAEPMGQPFGINPVGDVFLPVLVDLDDDGDLDLFYQSYEENTGSSFSFWENTGTPSVPNFEDILVDPFGIVDIDGDAHYPTFADLDNDGDLDLIASAYYGGTFYFYENTSNITPNNLPTSANAEITINENSDYVFSAADFAFFDDDAGDALAKVRIESLPSAGVLTLNSVPIDIETEIPVANLGNLVFAPSPDEFGQAYASFEFKVADNQDFSEEDYILLFNVDEVVSVDKLDLKVVLNLAPNPVHDELRLQANFLESYQNIELHVINVLGQTILNERLDYANTIQKDIDVTALSAGYYTLQLVADGKTKILPFVKR